MNLGEKVNFQEGTAAILLCARCKEPVIAGNNHECKELKDEDNQKKEE